MRVLLLHLVPYVVYGQSNAISCLYLLSNTCSSDLRSVWSIERCFHSIILFFAIILHFKFYPAIGRLKHVVFLGLQTLGVNYLSLYFPQ
jgi:hypothetical protein